MMSLRRVSSAIIFAKKNVIGHRFDKINKASSSILKSPTLPYFVQKKLMHYQCSNFCLLQDWTRVNTLRCAHRSEFHHRHTRIISFPNNKNDIAYHNDRNGIRINHILHAVSASSSSSTNDYAADYLQHMKFTNVKVQQEQKMNQIIKILIKLKMGASYAYLWLTRIQS